MTSIRKATAGKQAFYSLRPLAFAFMMLVSVGGKGQNFEWMRKTPASTSFPWTVYSGFGQEEKTQLMAVDMAGNVYLTCSGDSAVDVDPGPVIRNIVPFGGSDIILVKLNSEGVFQWVKHIGGPNGDAILAIVTDNNGNIYITGHFKGTVDFDPGPGVHNLTSGGAGYSVLGDAFILNLDSNGNFTWVKQFTGVGSEGSSYGDQIVIDVSGNVYSTGYFEDSVDFDPGIGSNLMSTGEIEYEDDFTGDIWTEPYANHYLVKLNSNGDFQWCHNIFGTADPWDWEMQTCRLKTDVAGNAYIAGDFNNEIWVDNWPNLLSSGAGFDDRNIYFIKWGPSGNQIWAKTFYSQANSWFYDFDVDANSNLYIFGSIEDSSDFDPGPGVYYLAPHQFWPSGYDNDASFISKIDSSGSLVWAKKLVDTTAHGTIGNAWDIESSLKLDSLGYIYLITNFQDSIDIDTGPGFHYLNSQDGFGLISKMDSDCNVIWAKQTHAGTSYVTMQSQNLYIYGPLIGTIDFDPGPGHYFSSGNYSYGVYPYYTSSYVLKLNQDTCSGIAIYVDSVSALSCVPLQIMLHAQAINGYPPYNYSWNTIPNTNAQSFVADTAGLYEVQVTDSHGCMRSTGIIVDSLLLDATNHLSITVDSTAAITCSSLQGYFAVHADGNPPYNYTWNTVPATNSSSLAPSLPGIYQIYVSDNGGCTKSMNLLMNAPSNLTSFDLNVNTTGWGFRPGFNNGIYPNAFNDGCITQAGILELVLDTALTYNGAWPAAPSQIAGDTLIWNFSNMNNTSPHLMPYVNVTTHVGTPLGYLVHLISVITPITGDADTTNNIKNFYGVVTGSYDPNETNVYPQGLCQEHYILPATKLTYTLGFQNTGTASAVNVFVIDSLDAGLNLNSVRVIGSSHSMYTEVLPGNVLKFHFDNIGLPDSNANDPASHGYVIFEVDPLPNLAAGTQIKNKASIYFDFNPPVVTNEVLNTIASSTGFPYVVSAALDHHCAISINQGNDSALYTYSYSSPPSFGSYASLKGLPYGSYTITVKDVNGCEISSNAVVVPDTQVVFVTPVSLLMPLCNGDGNGSLTVTTTGGVSPYNYLWGNGTTANTDTTSLANLSAGDYIVTTNDAYGCKGTDTFSLGEPMVLNDSLATVAVSCNGTSTGAATVYPSGGTAPYAYLWNTSPAQTNPAAVNLSVGSYSVTVTDTNGCTVAGTVSVTEPPALSGTLTGTSLSCYHDSSGTAAIIPAGGVYPYTYTWNTSPAQYTPAISGLEAGVYTVQLLDTNGCELIDSVTITEPAQLIANLSQTPDNGSCIGTATVSIQGGTQPYLISWTNGSNANTVTGLCEGYYVATVADSNGCMVVDSIYVPNPNSLSEVRQSGFRIYPNPATSTVTVEYEKEGTLELLDIVGKRMGSWELAGGRAQNAAPIIIGGRMQIDISTLPPGIYLYNYITKEGKKSGKLVIQH